MGRTKGEKAIINESKRLERERRKSIREANKMLIPTSEKTVKSMGTLSFDPSGTFRLTGNRWVKIYEVKEIKSNSEVSYENIADEIKGRIRVTSIILPQGIKIYATLMEEGEIYEEVRKDMIKDQEALSPILSLLPLTVDETMNEIMGEGCKPFSYASMVRGKKDWLDECLPGIVEDSKTLYINDLYAESMVVLNYPSIISINHFNSLKDIGCSIYISMDFKNIVDKTGFKQALEQRYNRRISKENERNFMNVSTCIMFSCDSEDARAIIEKTIKTMFVNESYALAPSYGCQRKAALSILSLGLMDYTVMRNVETKEAGRLFSVGGVLWQE